MARARVKRKNEERTDRLPVVAVLGMAVGFLGAYLGAETLMDPYAHPSHWLTAFAGGLVGYLAGALWYWRRGDIV